MDKFNVEELYKSSKIIENSLTKDRILNIYLSNLKTFTICALGFICIVLISFLVKIEDDISWGKAVFDLITSMPLIGIILKILIITSFPLSIVVLGYEFFFGMKIIKEVRINKKELRCYSTGIYELASNFDKKTNRLEYYLIISDMKISIKKSEFDKLVGEKSEIINIYFIPEFLEYKSNIMIKKYILDIQAAK